MAKKKFYVVWSGIQPGIYHSWPDCEKQVAGYTGAKYMSFETQEMAEIASRSNYIDYFKSQSAGKKGAPKKVSRSAKPDIFSICVDAACSGNPGVMEYQGVDTRSGKKIFRQGPFPDATNNIGEFLAIVHGLGYLKNLQSDMIVYSDSATAISWVKKKKAKTKLEKTPENKYVFELIDRAERWLETNPLHNKVVKWETEHWGEIPADFGRK